MIGISCHDLDLIVHPSRLVHVAFQWALLFFRVWRRFKRLATDYEERDVEIAVESWPEASEGMPSSAVSRDFVWCC
jgi:hypothetical protein